MAYPTTVETLPTNHTNGQVIDPAYDNNQARILNEIQAQLVSGGTHDLPGHAAGADPHTGYQKESEKGSANGYASLGADGLVPAAQLPSTAAGAFTGLSDVSGSFVAGSTIGRNATDFVPSGLIFSAVAYGVVGDDTNASATANQTAMEACITAAAAAGDGATVALDWEGTAYFNGGLKVHSRLWYRGTGKNKSKLANSRSANTNVWESSQFQTETQTIPTDSGDGVYEFAFTDHWIDGNKANNSSGGCGLAIVGYNYYLHNVHAENCKQAGIWGEWSRTTEPVLDPSGGGHKRGLSWGSVYLTENDCNTRPAANTRSSEGRSALQTGQLTLFGPGDSYIHEVEAHRGGSIGGIGLYAGIMDFTAASHNAFDLTIDVLTVWHNHDVAVDLEASGPLIKYIHAEGARVTVRIRGAGRPNILSGKMWSAQSSFTRSSTTTSGSATVSSTILTTGSNIVAGMGVTGTGIATGTFITAVNSAANTYTLSQNATASGTVTLTYIPTVLALIGSASGNFGWLQGHLMNNTANVTMIASNAACTEGTLKFSGEIGSTITIALTRGSIPSNAREIDISFGVYSGGTTATVDVGTWGFVTGVGPGTAYRLYRKAQPPLETMFSKAGDPTTTEIPSGLYAVYKNTSTSAVKLWVNDGGSLKSVALT